MTRIWTVTFGNNFDSRTLAGKDLETVLKQARLYVKKNKEEYEITAVKLIAETDD